MASELKLSGTTARVILQGNDSISSDQTFTFPDSGGEVLVSNQNDAELNSLTVGTNAQPSVVINKAYGVFVKPISTADGGSDTDSLWQGYGTDGSTITSKIRADGEAAFGTGTIGTSGGVEKVQINSGYGQIQVQSASGGNALFRGYNSDGVESFTVRGSGLAEFGNDINAVADSNASGGYRHILNNNGYYLQDSAGNSPIALASNGTGVFSGNITAANVSDIKFKENITDAKPQLSDVVALGSSLKNWDWKEEAPLNDELKSRRFLGLIAQEAEETCPGITYEVPNEEDSYKAINHDILVMKLLGAVAEQNARIEQLESRLAQLEGQS